MALSPGSRLDPYEVLAPLGAGGMGEVYRARDARLKQDVAIKVLAESVATDQDRVRRFEQEARSASALDHPTLSRSRRLRRWRLALLFHALDRNQVVFRVLLADLPGRLVFW